MWNLKPGAHVHLMGICGTAMASLAGLLKDAGYKVTGSDQNVYPPMSTQLEALGIDIMEGYRKENLNPRPDLVVVGNVITRNHEEAQALLATDIPYTSLPKALGEFVIADRQSIVMTGTHGKTTTTSLMAWVAESCGIKAGYLIGGIPLNFNKSFRVPKDPWFIIEGDEYDTAFFDKVPKFIHYRPRHVILTSIEFDHADIYKDLDHVKEAFKVLMGLIPEDGTLVYNGDDENIKSLLKYTKCKNLISYGLKHGDYVAVERENLAGRNHFCVEHKGEKIADVALKMFGPHNTLNALAAFALARHLKWDLAGVLQGLSSFLGVKRRQEFIGEPNGIKLIEDFAHHPTAVKLTVESMKEQFPGKKLIAVFEPRSATSRRKVFQQAYVDAFKSADISIVAEAFDQSKISEDDRFSVSQLVEDISKSGQKAFRGKNTDDLVELIKAQARPGDVVLLMSNGGFGGIYARLLSELEAN